MLRYSVKDYEAACISTNKVFERARKANFTPDSLSLLASAVRMEKEIRGWLELERQGPDCERIRRKYAPIPVQILAVRRSRDVQGKLEI